MQAYFFLSPWVLLGVFSVCLLLFALWVKYHMWCFCLFCGQMTPKFWHPSWFPCEHCHCEHLTWIRIFTSIYYALCLWAKFSWNIFGDQVQCFVDTTTNFVGLSFLFHWINTLLPNDNIEVLKYLVSDTFVSAFFKSTLANKLEPLLF